MNKQFWWSSKAAHGREKTVMRTFLSALLFAGRTARTGMSVLLLALLFAGPVAADSLWRDETPRSMFADKRARAVGDILTILVQESSTTTKDNKTATSRKSDIDAKIDAFLYSPNASKLLTKKGTLPALKLSSANNFNGGGSINNAEQVSAKISVRVVDVLPNGNLLVEGYRQIAFSGESGQQVLQGIVRTEDISANNTIFSSQVADVNIKFVSRGTVTDVQRKAWFTRIWDKLAPF